MDEQPSADDAPETEYFILHREEDGALHFEPAPHLADRDPEYNVDLWLRQREEASNNPVNWEYEDLPPEQGMSFYLIMLGGQESRLKIAPEPIGIGVPQTPENDADVQAIVDALMRIAARQA